MCFLLGHHARTLRSAIVVFLLSFAAGVSGLGTSVALAQADRHIERLNGQSVAPVYDGFEINPDGTYSMWFGYFNRNREERIDVPVGPQNRFDPEPSDRGQPTHFVPLWQKSVFRFIVPKDWGEKTLTWTLTTHGQTHQVTATLHRSSMIDRQKETLEGGAEGENKAPTVIVGPKAQAIAVSARASFTVSATDDGKPENRMTKKPDGLNVRWRKYRGPANGKVIFSPASAVLVDGASATQATFSEPGQYIVQAVVDDGSLLSGTYCCWINTELAVTVTR